MLTAKYFVFECYSSEVRLFADFGCPGPGGVPIPLSNPEFRSLQAQAIAEGKSLSYHFVSSGLDKQAAQYDLKQLNDSNVEYEDTPSSEESPDETSLFPVTWLPTCGSRLLLSRTGQRRES